MAAALLAAGLVLPMVPLAVWAFARGWRFPALLPNAWSLQGWQVALAPRTGLWDALGLTLLIAVLATGVSLVLGIPAGRVLAGARVPGRRLVMALVLVPLVVPGLAVAIGLHGVFLALGLTGTVAGVVIVHLVPVLPYVTLVMAAVFANHDAGLEAQARTLGASPGQVFRLVTLPAILPGVAVAAVMGFLVSWSQYALTLLVGGGKVITLPMLLFTQAAAGRNDVTGALAVLYVIPGLVAVALAARCVTGINLAIAARMPR